MADEAPEYRDLMQVPEQFEDGFDVKTVVGALFVGLVMLPGSIYLGLMAGQGMGPAAVWVTVILFSEVMRRSFSGLKRQEIYLLFYIASGLTVMVGFALAGGPFAGLIWNQYLVQNPDALSLGIAQDIPGWVAPPAGSEALARRTFIHRDWLYPILLLVIYQVLSRMSWFGMGYLLFRITSDVEGLPFPMAPVAAAGAVALAETDDKSGRSWRWSVFSTGAAIGLLFGAVYVGIPSLTGAMFAKPLTLLPIPWIDLTASTENVLPATPTGITCDLASIFVGFVLPFWVIVGGFIAALTTLVVNPILQRTGVLHTWRPGMDTITTQFVNGLDFWLSVGIGVAFAVAVIGLWSVISSMAKGRSTGAAARLNRGDITKRRGDIPVWLAIGLYVVSTCGYLLLCAQLVDGFKLLFFALYGFIYAPIVSYVNARMIGMTGQFFGIPFAREGAFILSGAQGAAIWFAPIPADNFGGYAQSFREIELTGTRFRGIIKAELLMLPVGLICSFIFWQYVWRLAPIPSQSYPFALKFWRLAALNQLLWISSTSGGAALFERAMNLTYILGGLGFGLAAYGILSWLSLPVLLVYGFIRGMGQLPHYVLPEIAGALLGRYWLAKRFGRGTWHQYSPVLFAGYLCGVGLIGTVGIAITLIGKSVRALPF